MARSFKIGAPLAAGQAEREANRRGESPVFHRAVFTTPRSGISKVKEAQKLCQSALPPSDGIMCTALTSHTPACGRRNATRPAGLERGFQRAFVKIIELAADRNAVSELRDLSAGAGELIADEMRGCLAIDGCIGR